MIYPLVMSKMAIENGDLEWIYTLKMDEHGDFP